MGGKSSPPTPDYVGAAKQQGVENVNTAIANAWLNNPKQVSPLGTKEYTQYGSYSLPSGESVPMLQSTTSLTPEGQSRYDQEQRIIGNLGNVAESGLNRVGNSMASPFTYDSVDQAQNAAQDAISSRMEPQFARDEEAMRTRLANQGLSSGTEAYQRDYDAFNRSKVDARQQAILQANQIRPGMIQEQMALRNIPLNEVNALRSGSQVSMPQFQGYTPSNISPAPYFQATQAQGQADMNTYNAKTSQQNAGLGGLFSMGGSILGASGVPWWLAP